MSHHEASLALQQVNIIVRDMQRALAFYALLGLSIEDGGNDAWSLHHARGWTSNGLRVEFDSVAFAQQWNPALDATKLGSGTQLFFQVATREDVDRVYSRILDAGYGSQKAPDDGFWGARYAIVEDPDGHAVGIISSIDPSKRRPPPPAPR